MSTLQRSESTLSVVSDIVQISELDKAMTDPLELHMTNHAERFATESELKAVLAEKNTKVIEWEQAGMTFIKSDTHLVILRAGAFGGDTRVVHGGWKYTTPFGMQIEWNEIRQVAPAYAKRILF